MDPTQGMPTILLEEGSEIEVLLSSADIPPDELHVLRGSSHRGTNFDRYLNVYEGRTVELNLHQWPPKPDTDLDIGRLQGLRLVFQDEQATPFVIGDVAYVQNAYARVKESPKNWRMILLDQGRR